MIQIQIMIMIVNSSENIKKLNNKDKNNNYLK
jgi:hypothetical protein